MKFEYDERQAISLIPTTEEDREALKTLITRLHNRYKGSNWILQSAINSNADLREAEEIGKYTFIVYAEERQRLI